MKRFAMAILILFPLNSALAQSIAAGSVWVNDGGSELTITTVGSDGAISGTYINKVEGFDCKNEPMAVNGWVDGDLLSFSVRWKNAAKDCGSITAWTGYVAAGQIFTDWDLVYTAAATGLPTHLKQSNVFHPK